MSSCPRLLSLLGVLLLLLAPALPAQKDGKVQHLIPERIERATKDDAQGLQQWAEWKPDKCPNCNGAKTVDCPHCPRFEGNKKCIECQMKKKATCTSAGLEKGNKSDQILSPSGAKSA